MQIFNFKVLFNISNLFKVHPKGRVVHKGINPEVDSYSAFFDNAKLGKTSLEEVRFSSGEHILYSFPLPWPKP